MARRGTLTKLEILQVATRMFLERGFSHTTAKEISNELNISTGNLTFHYPTKEHILLELTKEIMNFHGNAIKSVQDETKDNLFAYCWEITAQIAMCEEHQQMNDLYLAIYSHPMTLSLVKDWTADKNLNVLGEFLPDWDYTRFRKAVNITCCIERSGMTEPCTEDYPLEEKIRLTLTCLLKIYDIEKSERERVIKQILSTDYRKASDDLLSHFIQYIEKHNKEVIEEVLGI